MASRKVKIQGSFGTISGILDSPRKVLAGLTLAHGAGAGMLHPFISELASSLSSAGFAVLRFQFPYMEAGKKKVDSPKVAIAAIIAAVEKLSETVKAPLFAGGKSFGARMTTTAAAGGMLPEVRGVLCFGFPLHSIGTPSIDRANHLNQLPCPALFLQGSRDDLADLALMQTVCSKLPNATLCVINDADHGFSVLKRSGRTAEQVMAELTHESVQFVRKLL